MPPSPPPSPNTKQETLQYLCKEITNLAIANKLSYGCIAKIFIRERKNYTWLSLLTLSKSYSNYQNALKVDREEECNATDTDDGVTYISSAITDDSGNIIISGKNLDNEEDEAINTIKVLSNLKMSTKFTLHEAFHSKTYLIKSKTGPLRIVIS